MSAAAWAVALAGCACRMRGCRLLLRDLAFHCWPASAASRKLPILPPPASTRPPCPQVCGASRALAPPGGGARRARGRPGLGQPGGPPAGRRLCGGGPHAAAAEQAAGGCQQWRGKGRRAGAGSPWNAQAQGCLCARHQSHGVRAPEAPACAGPPPARRLRRTKTPTPLTWTPTMWRSMRWRATPRARRAPATRWGRARRRAVGAGQQSRLGASAAAQPQYALLLLPLARRPTSELHARSRHRRRSSTPPAGSPARSAGCCWGPWPARCPSAVSRPSLGGSALCAGAQHAPQFACTRCPAGSHRRVRPCAPHAWPCTQAGPNELLTAGQLSRMADHFTASLCSLKHNGAVDKTQQGFAALCERCVGRLLPPPSRRPPGSGGRAWEAPLRAPACRRPLCVAMRRQAPRAAQAASADLPAPPAAPPSAGCCSWRTRRCASCPSAASPTCSPLRGGRARGAATSCGARVRGGARERGTGAGHGSGAACVHALEEGKACLSQRAHLRRPRLAHRTAHAMPRPPAPRHCFAAGLPCAANAIFYAEPPTQPAGKAF